MCLPPKFSRRSNPSFVLLAPGQISHRTGQRLPPPLPNQELPSGIPVPTAAAAREARRRPSRARGSPPRLSFVPAASGASRRHRPSLEHRRSAAPDLAPVITDPRRSPPPSPLRFPAAVQLASASIRPRGAEPRRIRCSLASLPRRTLPESSIAAIAMDREEPIHLVPLVAVDLPRGPRPPEGLARPRPRIQPSSLR